MKAKFFFTLPHNNPSGGVKVVNEFVNLCIEQGYESYLCLPEEEKKLATFISDPAPVISLTQMVKDSTVNDYIISCWQSKIEFESVKKSRAKKKIFWQHGLLIANQNTDVGDEVYTSNVFDLYANVSYPCGKFIEHKYKKDKVHILNPFFDIQDKLDSFEKKEGFLVLARRGAEYIPKIQNY